MLPRAPPGGLVEGASAGQHVAEGAAWVDLPQANPSGRASRERASQYPQRSRPSEQRHNDERREPRRSLRSSPKDEGLGRGRGKKSTNGFSPPGCGDPSQRPQSLWLRGVARGPAVLAWRFACPAVASHPLRQPTVGMLVPSRLARGQFFPQRPLCDLISASLMIRECAMPVEAPRFSVLFLSS